MKYIKKYENSDTLWLVTVYESRLEPYQYLFNNEKVMFDFLINYIYNIFKTHVVDDEELTLEDYLEELDSYQTVDKLVGYYNDIIHENEIFEGSIAIETSSIINNIIVDDWIKIRRDAKKYNL